MSHGEQGAKRGAFGRFLAQAMPEPGVEQRIIDGALERMHGQRRRRRLAVVGLAATAAAAAGVCAIVWLSRAPSTPGPTVSTGGGQQRIAKTARPAARVWTAAKKPATYRLGPHRVTLSAGTRVRLRSAAPAAPRLTVRRGEAEFRVQPLERGDSFVVQTKQVRVEVVGTRFSVSSGQRCSQVRVLEGTVRVTARGTGEAHLLRHGADRTFCDGSPLAQGLGEGDELVRRAQLLLLEGKDVEQADRLLTRYLERYPGGPFAQEALFHQVFARWGLGRHQEARALAREFLRRFPSTSRAARMREWLDERR
jgi:ferric-dicitrate binding protein FerR (iron transport regulator)